MSIRSTREVICREKVYENWQKGYELVGEVVRCKDCRMTRGRDEHIGRWWCFVHQGYMADDYYCADGKRREDGEA